MEFPDPKDHQVQQGPLVTGVPLDLQGHADSKCVQQNLFEHDLLIHKRFLDA
jgi:hypothetical protein